MIHAGTPGERAATRIDLTDPDRLCAGTLAGVRRDRMPRERGGNKFLKACPEAARVYKEAARRATAAKRVMDPEEAEVLARL